MGILDINVMNNFNFFIVIAILLLFVSCTAKTETNFVQSDNNQRIDYVINENLFSKKYSNIEGYFPKDGLVPTAEIAFQIAQSVLVQIYGKETIEGEKPFAINLKNGIWMIEGSLKEGYKGGVAYIEIQKSNGKILKVVHTK